MKLAHVKERKIKLKLDLVSNRREIHVETNKALVYFIHHINLQSLPVIKSVIHVLLKRQII